MSNELKMPFAEWLFRMSEKAVPYQARALAVYSVVFKVTANDELAILSGMDMKGVADKTYNKWKKQLADGGWVILKSGLIGRVTTIEVSPAFEARPVTFTDVVARVPGKFGELTSVKITGQETATPITKDVKVTEEAVAEPVEVTRKNYGAPVKSTRKKYERPVEITIEAVKITDDDGRNYGSSVEVTAEPENSPAPAPAEVDNNYINKNNNLPTLVAGSSSFAAREAPSIPDIPGLNGSTAMLVGAVARMFSQLAPDLFVARQQVESACTQYGVENFRDGFAELSAKVADGTQKNPSFRTLCSYVQQAKKRRDRDLLEGRTPGAKPVVENDAQKLMRLMTNMRAKKAEKGVSQ